MTAWLTGALQLLGTSSVVVFVVLGVDLLLPRRQSPPPPTRPGKAQP